jgi:hypothetical protein
VLPAPTSSQQKSNIYDPLEVKNEPCGNFSLKYDPLEAKIKKEEDELLSSFEKNLKGKIVREKIHKQIRDEKEGYEKSIQLKEERLPSYLKHLPREMPEKINKLDSSIKNRICKDLFHRINPSEYKDKVN